MKVLLVNGGPHPKGCTNRALEEVEPPVCRIQKFNMKWKGRVYREIYMLYFFCPFLEKSNKKLLAFCYWSLKTITIR